MEELPLLERLQRKHDKSFTVVSINIVPEDNDAALELMRGRGYTFTALSAPDGDWAGRRGIKTAPANFLLDRSGRVVLRPVLNTPAARSIAQAEVEALIGR